MQLLFNTHWYIWLKIQGEPPLNSPKTKKKQHKTKTKNKNKNKQKKKTHFNLLYIMTAIFVDNKIYN